MAEADERTTLGVVEGTTRTTRGVMGETVIPEEVFGFDVITSMVTLVGGFMNHTNVSQGYLNPSLEVK